MRFTGAKDTLIKSFILFSFILFVGIIISLIAGMVAQKDLLPVEETIQHITQTQPLFLIYLFIVRIVSEEIFFRGFLVPKIGALGSSALFGLLHFAYGSIFEVIGAFVLGLILAYGFKKFKTLYPNIIAHFAYNAFMFALTVI